MARSPWTRGLTPRLGEPSTEPPAHPLAHPLPLALPSLTYSLGVGYQAWHLSGRLPDAADLGRGVPGHSWQLAQRGSWRVGGLWYREHGQKRGEGGNQSVTLRPDGSR